MSAADRYLELLGMAAITVSEPAIIVNIAPRDILVVELVVVNWSATSLDIGMRFNADTGAHYSLSNASVASGGTTWSNGGSFNADRMEFGANGAASAAGCISVFWISNELANVKTGVGWTNRRFGDVSSSQTIEMLGFCWNNTTQQISSIWINTAGDGLGGITTMGAGSYIKVHGFNLSS